MAKAGVGEVLLIAGRLQAGGSSSYTTDLARGLRRHGIGSRILCAAFGPVVPDEQVQVEVLRGIDRRFLGLLTKRRLRRAVARSVPDVIHVQSQHVLKAGMWLAQALHRPYVVTIHQRLNGCSLLRKRHAWLRGIIAVSQPVRESLVNNAAVPKEWIKTIYNGVDLRKYDVVPFRLNAPVPVVGSIGRLTRMRGHEYFIRAMKDILDAGRHALFFIAGDGPEERRLRKLAREFDVERHLTFVSDVLDPRPVLAAADIFVMPSLEEGLGFAVLEAMAMGKPVVASATGGMYEVVKDGETGYLVPRGNPEALATAISQLLDRAEHAQQLGLRARKVVEARFGLERPIRQIIELYKESLGEPDN